MLHHFPSSCITCVGPSALTSNAQPSKEAAIHAHQPVRASSIYTLQADANRQSLYAQVVRFVDLNDEAIAALQAALQVQVQQPPRRVTFLGCPDSCSSAMQEVQQRIEVCVANISHHLVSCPFVFSSGGDGLGGGGGGSGGA